MTVVVSATWFAQFFLAGLPIIWVGAAGRPRHRRRGRRLSRLRRTCASASTASSTRPSGDTYQIDRSLEAFANGGLFGRGPGEGTVKDVLPDAHADFIFAVAGEEFGLIVCLLLVALLRLRRAARLSRSC